ncbi:hypothetical protein [Bacillus mycoides]|uniref:hypothetical protein n=1 Tax=Bacillus mycoides TaxID=1405 RepID=UPI0003E1CF7A|nr:hypothetical protein [Bacillus mycoides]ETT85576.1 hypothetical protein C174_01799 [Bacillus mycoides FSL H7-687]
MSERYNLVVSEEQLQILIGAMFYFGQQTMGPSKFFEDFINDYSKVYKKDGKKHLFKTRSFLHEGINYPQFLALLFHTSELLAIQKKENTTPNINDTLDCLIKDNPQLRDMGQAELMNLIVKNLGLLLKQGETKD